MKMTDSAKCDSTKFVNDEDLPLHFKVPSNSGRIKSSGLSSDEETTSSSLLPIPDTLRQMRGQLKKINTDAGEHTEVDTSSISAYIATEDISNSLQQLRKKYALKNEASVTMKMNSANLMLDDILNGKNVTTVPCGFKKKYFVDQLDVKGQKVDESDSSSLVESVTTIKHCDHVLQIPSLVHGNTPVPYEVARPYCQRHEKSYRPVCLCSNFYEKGLQVTKSEYDERPKKAMSFFEKLQNLHLKCKIQSVYKIVQKNNPFSKDRKEEESIEQGIPSTAYPENSGCNRKTCDEKGCRTYHYPRRMVFDLVESSDTCQSEERSTARDSENYQCPTEIKCTCYDPKECTCPELMPECTCDDKIQQPSNVCAEHTSSPKLDRIPDIPPVKINEFVQTECNQFSEKDTKGENIDPFVRSKLPQNSRFSSAPDASANNRMLNQSSQPAREFKNNLRKEPRRCYFRSRLFERTDIYYFDHGNASYYRTTDNHPMRYTECLVDRTDEYATKFWGEVFGVVEIGMAFLISFFLQLYRFFFTSIIRSLTVGLLQIFSDYFFKPLLTIMFNGIIQPCLILVYNIATSVRDLCFPISQIFGFFTKEVANLFRSCRLVDINHSHCKQSIPACNCGNKANVHV